MTTIAPHLQRSMRRLNVSDLSSCEGFGQAFYKEMGLPGRFDIVRFVQTWTQFLAADDAVIFGLWEDEVLTGGLGAKVLPDLYDGRLCATEFFWYVRPESRHGSAPWKLIRAFEVWGNSLFVEEFRLTHILKDEDPESLRLGPMYKRMGYRQVEVNYVKPARGV